MRGGKRLGAGRKPGSGGKPAGAITKAKRDLMAMAKGYGAAALKTLATIHADVAAPPAARVAAAVAILDRGYGKPPQAIVPPDGSAGTLVISWKSDA